MLNRVFISIFIFCLCSCASEQGQSEDGMTVVRLNGGEPIITQNMFADAGIADDGKNINGPSVIRIPDWIVAEDRVHPDAKFYLYFAHHKGEYIRMAWASEIAGPWSLYNMNADVAIGDRGVLDHGQESIVLDNNIVIDPNHLASPDVHVDDVNKRIVMYFHTGSSTYVNGERIKEQLTFVATSSNGLEFYDGIKPVILGSFYFRVFAYGGDVYALNNGGTLYKAPSADSLWTRPEGFDYRNELWEMGNNPFQEDITADSTSTATWLRHTTVRVVGDELQVLYTRTGDSPERVMMSTIDMSASSWLDWKASYPPVEVLRAEEPWEGANFAASPSVGGNAPEDVNQLRDPYLLDDGGLYVFYAGGGEDAIGVFKLTLND